MKSFIMKSCPGARLDGLCERDLRRSGRPVWGGGRAQWGEGPSARRSDAASGFLFFRSFRRSRQFVFSSCLPSVEVLTSDFCADLLPIEAYVC